MIVSASITVVASQLYDREAFPEFERYVREELEREAAKRGEALDPDWVIISSQTETDGALSLRQAEFDEKCDREGRPSHDLIRIAWIRAEASVPGPTNGEPGR